MQTNPAGGSPLRQIPAGQALASSGPPRSASQSASNQAPPVLITTERAAREVFDVSPRTFQTMRQQEWFTVRPRVLGPKTVRWVRQELEGLALSIPSSAAPEQPAPLRRRIEALKAGAQPLPA